MEDDDKRLAAKKRCDGEQPRPKKTIDLTAEDDVNKKTGDAKKVVEKCIWLERTNYTNSLNQTKYSSHFKAD